MPAIATKDTITGQYVINVGGLLPLSKNVAIQFINITVAGIYNVGVVTTSGKLGQFIQMFESYTDSAGQTIRYTSPVPSANGSGAGTVIISELTAASLKATFSGTLTKSSGSSGAPISTISNGSVNVTIK
jgi:hypothetical protein